METDRFPQAVLTVAEPFDVTALAEGPGRTTVDGAADLDLHGVTERVRARRTAVRTAGGVEASGQVPVVLADHGIDDPSIGGSVTTEGSSAPDLSCGCDAPDLQVCVGTCPSGHAADVAPATERTIVVPSVPASVASVRRYTVAACRQGGLGELADTAALLVSEVATNALVHGSGDVRVCASVSGRSLRVEVSDDDPAMPAPRHASDTDEGGRGLALLEALAGSWGTTARSGGKTVWFVLTG